MNVFWTGFGWRDSLVLEDCSLVDHVTAACFRRKTLRCHQHVSYIRQAGDFVTPCRLCVGLGWHKTRHGGPRQACRNSYGHTMLDSYVVYVHSTENHSSIGSFLPAWRLNSSVPGPQNTTFFGLEVRQGIPGEDNSERTGKDAVALEG